MSIVVEASGSGREMGRAHGEACRFQIASALSAWGDATLARSRHSTPLDYAKSFIEGTKLLDAMSNGTPHLLAEIEGIAEASGQPFELIAAYNLMDEQWWYDLGDAPEPGCSLMGVIGQDGTMLCQNMDLPKFMDGSQVVLHLHPQNGHDQVILTSAGLIGLTGASAAGIGICVNTLLMLNHDSGGLPVAAVFRQALAQPDGEAALKALRSVTHASGQHYAVADRRTVLGLECSASGCVEVELTGSVLRHTNHPIAGHDEHEAKAAILEARGRITNSRDRLDHLASLEARGVDATQLRAWLDAPGTPICVTPGGGRPGFTFGSIVIEIGAITTVGIRPSFPGDSDWQTFTL